MTWNIHSGADISAIQCYEIYVLKFDSNNTNNNVWQFIGAVDALPLPMACTLSLVSLINLILNIKLYSK